MTDPADGNSLLHMTTPGGHPAVFEVRDGSSDHNTVWSCVQEDEYHLRGMALEGTALDAGAHIGGVSVALALDHPGLRVVAIEPVPPNVALLRANLARNGVADRVTVVAGAVAAPGMLRAIVAWDFAGGVSAEHHRYIGNVRHIPYEDCEQLDVEAWDMGRLVGLAGGSITFAKVDCEGGEYGLLRSSAVAQVATIVGEFHAGYERLVRLLERTHEVSRTSGDDGLGGFVAHRRA